MMPLRPTITLACLATLIAAGPSLACHSPGVPSAQGASINRVTGAAGCYALRLGAWRPKQWRPEPPSRFTLTTDVLILHHPPWRAFRAEPKTPDSNDPAHPPYWRLLPRDSLEVIWSNGLYGVLLRLRSSRVGLEGSAFGLSDIVGLQSHTAEATAERITCTNVTFKWLPSYQRLKLTARGGRTLGALR